MKRITPSAVLVIILANCLAAAPSDADLAEAEAAAQLEKLMGVRVQTVTLRKQKLRDAPANVTVISADDIRRYGYRTLAEVLANTRSFYTTSDGGFIFPGVRGFGLLGDYNMRFLVMVNGHRLTDIVYGAMYLFGQDFPLDLSLIEQIEVVRGPSSALYGSNGVFATINIITRSAQASPRISTALEAGSFGEQKANVSTAFNIGRDASLMLSGSVFHTRGRDIDLTDLPGGTQRARNLGNEEGFHSFATLNWRDLRLTGLFGSRRAALSHGWYGTSIGNTGTTDLESRNFLEAAWSRRIGESGELNWRAYYDQFRYDGVYRLDDPVPYSNFDGAFGDWIGSDMTYRHELKRFGAVTVGVEAKHELRNTQYIYDLFDGEDPSTVSKTLLTYPDRAQAVFVQHELSLTPNWMLYLGGRVDSSRRNSTYLSPRIALIANRGRSTYKMLYGRAFRNPSTYERYWEPNPDLSAEVMNTVEFINEHQLGKRTRLTTSLYHYRLASLIEGVPTTETTLQYRNTTGAASTGVEGELSTYVTDWLEASSALTVQHTRRRSLDQELPNSPKTLALFRASIPLRSPGITLSGAARYIGTRIDAYAGQVPSATVADATATSHHLGNGIEMQLGIRNILNRRYADPLSTEHTPRVLPSAGRTWFVRLSWARE